MKKVKKYSDSDVLKVVTLVTSLGDFITKFAFIKIVYDSSQSVLISSTAVIIEAAAIPIAGFLGPYIQSKFRTNSILFSTQGISTVFSFALLCSYLFGFISPFVLGPILLSLNFLSELFKSTRELHTKHAGEKNHLLNQSKVMSGFYNSQFLGPLISLGLIVFLPMWIPLAIDLASFAISAVIIKKSKLQDILSTGSNSLRPFFYIWKDIELTKIFFLRAIGFWISAGIFNYLIYSMVTTRFSLNPIMTAWIYSAGGFGAAIAAYFISNNRWVFEIMQDKHLTIFGHTGMAATVVGFVYSQSFVFSLLILSIYGFFMGINAIGSQAIRRRLIKPENFAEIIGAEAILSKLVDVTASTIVFTTLYKIGGKIENWLIFSASLTFIVGLLFSQIKKEGEPI